MGTAGLASNLDGIRVLVEPPNKRLKLTAPFVYGKLSFVIIHARRRSLSAMR